MKFARPITLSMNVEIFWPRRNLKVRRKGKWYNLVVPIFPGYLFLQIDSLSTELYWRLKRIPGFYRFLKNNLNITPLPPAEAAVLTHLLKFGEVVRKSVVTFDENNRIRIIEGPLKGLEGRIVKVDRRKERAKVRLDLYEKSYLVDFGFKSIEKLVNKI
jgi:transcriptional antiterminator NusG